NTTVTCTASDPSGNTATSTFVVRVSQSSLPATGNNAKRAVSIAFAVLALGTLLLTTTRRRRTI
ncbi:MAG TPA: LPXTG cell wall anchor domain-containing protein, partial [Ilumatobacteraceae bacterium]